MVKGAKTKKSPPKRTGGKRKSVSIVVDHFLDELRVIGDFVDKARAPLPLSSRYHSWFFDYAIVRLYREFELFVLKLLIAAIHQDTTTLQQSAALTLPKKLPVDVCEFLIVGHGFFDLKGRAGAIGKLKDFLPADHYILSVISDKKYLDSLDLLFVLRNFAAHQSKPSKKAALRVLVERYNRQYPKTTAKKAVSTKGKPKAKAPPAPQNIGSSGMWLMSQEAGTTRFAKILKDLKALATDIQSQAPF